MSEIDSEELAEWLVMDRDYHILPDSWVQSGIVASTVANCMAPRKGNPYDHADFMPQMRQRKQSPEEIMQQLRNAWG